MIKKDNPILEKSSVFAVKIVGLCRKLQEQKEFIISRQLYRCGTSIGANVAEAQGAISKADFFAKMKIADKEAKESSYWLTVLRNANSIEEINYAECKLELDEICKLLTRICKTTEAHINQEAEERKNKHFCKKGNLQM